MCSAHPSPLGNEGITLGEHFIAQDRTTARVGKIFHMRVPGDIIAGSDGQDVPACWTQRFNAPGMDSLEFLHNLRLLSIQLDAWSDRLYHRDGVGRRS